MFSQNRRQKSAWTESVWVLGASLGPRLIGFIFVFFYYVSCSLLLQLTSHFPQQLLINKPSSNITLAKLWTCLFSLAVWTKTENSVWVMFWYWTASTRLKHETV